MISPFSDTASFTAFLLGAFLLGAFFFAPRLLRSFPTRDFFEAARSRGWSSAASVSATYPPNEALSTPASRLARDSAERRYLQPPHCLRHPRAGTNHPGNQHSRELIRLRRCESHLP